MIISFSAKPFNMKQLLSLTFLLTFILNGFGQQAPIKYGKLTEEETGLSEYNNADAVILCDYGQYYFDGTYGKTYFNFKRNLRIKILTEEGLKYAQQKIEYYDLKTATSLFSSNRAYILKAQTLNMNNEGEWKKTKVKARNIKSTEPDDIYNVELTIDFPNAKVGSIIEYEITIPTIEIVTPKPWYFQYDIPVFWSEIRLLTTQSLIYDHRVYNVDYLNTQDSILKVSSISYRSRIYSYNSVQYQLVKQFIPPFTTKDNITDNSQRMQAKFMLVYATKRYALPYMDDLFKAVDQEYKYKDRSEKNSTLDNVSYIFYKQPSLEELPDKLLSDDQFGRPLMLFMGLRDTVDSITYGISNKEEQMYSIYNYIKDHMIWNNDYRIFVRPGIPKFLVKTISAISKETPRLNNSLNIPYRRQEGSTSEINFMVINLLRLKGFDANPVLVSTVDHSYLDKDFFSLHDFNHVLVHVNLDGKTYLLDAVQGPEGVLMDTVPLNRSGLLITNSTANWIDISKN